MKTIVLVTGGFDPIHSGHIDYLKAAKALGDILVVGVNSDAWLAKKKGQAFMPLRERAAVIRAMGCVDFVIDFNDDEAGTAKDAIAMVRASYPQDTIIFANGGDRTAVNIPEMDIKDSNLIFKFGVGGLNKANSSSWILQEWKAPKVERQWGYYRVLHTFPGGKVKELTVLPRKKLSMQRHFKRAEHWHVSEGEAYIGCEDAKDNFRLRKHEFLEIGVGQWHQLCNNTDTPLQVVEIQYGEACVEEDIERLDEKLAK
jgi:D-beta-D-heptose 7-phosphate kinase/D-beta-D-heptose 1-phosphate adenosyltransferase